MIKSAIFLFAIFIVQASYCPSKVQDELELVTLAPECFRKAYDSETHDGHKLSRILNERIANYKRILQDIKMNDVDHLKTHPVIKWAQSQSQIFLNLRLSHRHDSPTCSDIRYEIIATNIQQTEGDFSINKIINQPLEKNSSRMTFQSQCFFTHQKLLFNSDIEFRQKITRLTVKKQGFGRYTIVGHKQVNSIWINPFTGWENAGIWSDLRNKNEKDMDKYFELMEGLGQLKASRPKRKFKNKKAQQQFQMGGQL